MPEWNTYDFRIGRTTMTSYRERMQAGEYDKPKPGKDDKADKPKTAATPKRSPGRPRKNP